MTLEEAQRQLRQLLIPVAAKTLVPVSVAVNRILSSDLIAPIDLPRDDRAALDGYAFQSADRAGADILRLRLVGRSAAGHPYAGPAEAGSAVRILTGGSLPAGYDSVVMQEICTEADGVVSFQPAALTGNHVRRRGEDCRAGTVILPRGHRLRPADLGIASGCGLAMLPVYETLRVALFSTGDELVEPGLDLPPGHIWDANRAMLKALVQESGAAVSDLGILPDRFDDMQDALTRAAHDHDLIVTSGGMSVGDEDHVKQIINRRGRLEMWRLAIKPGKPVGFGDIDDCPIIALPGNPVAAVVTFLTLGRLAVSRLSGGNEGAVRQLYLPAGSAIRKQAGRRDFLLARLVAAEDGLSRAVPLAKQGSAMLSSLMAADGLIDLDEDVTEISPGETIRYLPLPSF
jgi:molybdopterin molybdotransferase